MRNVLGVKNAQHVEYDAYAPNLVIVPASYPVIVRPQDAPRLTGAMKIRVRLGSLAYRIYRAKTVNERFHCNNELNPDFERAIEEKGMTISGRGEHGEARIIELNDHPFFLATGFQPQLSSEENRPHSLIMAFLKAAREASV